MKAHILTGSKQDIADTVARIDGEVFEAIVFVDTSPVSKSTTLAEDIFAEMESLSVKAGGADYSRQSLYSRMEDE